MPGRTLVRTAFILSALCMSFAPASASPFAVGDTISTVVLSANFNGDAVGLPPDVALPGEPDGDFLTLNQTAGTIRVVASSGGLTNKPIEMKQSNAPGGIGVSAWPAPSPEGCEAVTVSWQSLARDDNPVYLLRCELFGSGGGLIASVDYLPHRVLKYNLASTLPVRYQNNEAQSFSIRVDWLAHTTSLTIDGEPVAGFQGVPFATPATDLARVAFEGDQIHPQTLVIDDVSVVALCRTPDHAPRITAPSSVEGAEGSAIGFTVSAADPDGEPIQSLIASSLPAGATFTLGPSGTSGSFDWLPDFTQAGTYEVVFQASNVLTGTAATAITIGNTDRAPAVTAPEAIGGEEGGTLQFSVTVADPDGELIGLLSADLSALPATADATFTPNPTNTGGEFLWHMDAGEAGAYPVQFTASNAGTGSAQSLLTVAVTGVSVTGSLIWTPEAGEEGSHLVTFTATDRFGDTNSSVTDIIVSAPASSAAPRPAAGSASIARPRALLTPGEIQKGPVVSSPSRAEATVGKTVIVTATATDTTVGSGGTAAASFGEGSEARRAGWLVGQAAQLTLTADLSQVPGAIFVVDRDPVVTAASSVSAAAGSAFSLPVSVTDPDGDPILDLSADLSGLPLPNNATFTSNPTHTGGTFAWTPDVGDSGDYVVSFTASNNLVGQAETSLHVRGFAASRVFVMNQKKIRLSSNKPSDCVFLEPVAGSFALEDVELSTVRMVSLGTGVVSEISAIFGKSTVIGDRDNNEISDMQICFSKGDYRLLFSALRGSNAVPVMIQGSLATGGMFQALLTLNVIAGGGPLQATVYPNPLNPAAQLTFLTTKRGPVTVRLFDLSGRMVREVLREPSLERGGHTVLIDGRDLEGRKLASGVYFFRIEAADEIETGRFAIMK